MRIFDRCQAARAERFTRLTSGEIGDPMPKSGILCGNSTPETGVQAPAIPVKLQTGAISKKMFSMRLRKHSGTGLSNKRFRLWLASRSQSNLIRYAFFPLLKPKSGFSLRISLSMNFFNLFCLVSGFFADSNPYAIA